MLPGTEIPDRTVTHIELYALGKLPYDRFVKYYDFSEINKAVNDSKSGQVIKSILRMD